VTASPIAERAELLSDRWIALAGARLSELVTENAGAIGGQRFSICEEFSHAPPHLGYEGGVASWHARIAGGAVSFARGRISNADLYVRADYAAGLLTAQAVGDVAMERAGRLMAHLFPDRPMSLEGTPPTGILLQIFMVLHDYLAQRTVDVPDLDYRIDRQGLRTQVRHLRDNGYAVLERAIPDALADELRELCLDAVQGKGREITRLDRSDCMGLIGSGRAFEEIAQHPTLRTLMESVLGTGLVLSCLSAAVKGPGPSAVPIHTDYSYVPEPYPEFALNGVAVWALDDWTLEAGPTIIIPGSQRQRRAPDPRFDDLSGGVPAIMPKGSVVFFAQGVWHWQGDRTAPGYRVSMHNVYSRPFMRSHDNFVDMDPLVLHRNSPVLSSLTGHDDPFEKSSFYGHDAARAVYTDSRVNWGRQRGDGGYKASYDLQGRKVEVAKAALSEIA
jgi:hypothetical protein